MALLHANTNYGHMMAEFHILCIPNSFPKNFFEMYILVFCRNNCQSMENHGLGRDTLTKFMLSVQLEIPQTPHNFFGPSAQFGQLFQILLKKVLVTCPLSMHTSTACFLLYSLLLLWDYGTLSRSPIAPLPRNHKHSPHSSRTVGTRGTGGHILAEHYPFQTGGWGYIWADQLP